MIYDCLQTVGPHPLPGMVRMTHVPAISVEKTTKAVQRLDQGAWLLLDAENPQWAVPGAASELLASIKTSRPDLNVVAYPLPKAELGFRAKDRAERWCKKNDNSLARWQGADPGLSGVAGECYFRYAPGDRKYQQEQAKACCEEALRLVRGTDIKPMIVVQPFWRLSKGDSRDMLNVEEDLLRERADIIRDAGCDLVWWGGWIPKGRYLAARGFEGIKGQSDFVRATAPNGVSIPEVK